MDRRKFIALLGGAAGACPFAARAQQPRVARVGLLSPESPTETRVNGFREGLRELGYFEGKNIQIEYRWANGAFNRLPDLAAELVNLNVDVIVTYVTQASVETKRATATIPIVMVGVADPVGTGLIASLAHPGGNVTGVSSMAADLVGKQLQLLQEVLPGASRLAVLWNPENVAFQKIQMRQVEDARRATGIELQLVEARSPNDFANVFAAIRNAGTRGLLVLAEPVFESNFRALAKLALEDRLPTVGARGDFVEAGGLLAYGSSWFDFYKRAAAYVDKILKGTRPADLPVEQATRFELILNLRTAKALSLDIPSSILVRADKIIE